MRYIRLMHFIFIAILLLLDTFISGIFNSIGFKQIFFVSNLAFLGIVLLIQNDSRKESILKAILLSFWMDLNHVNSFPVFFVSYTITILIMRLWQRQISGTYLEFSVIAVVALFIKESLTFLLLLQTQNIDITYLAFISNRMFWVIIFNTMMVYPLLQFYRKIHHIILSKTQDLRTY